MKEMYNIVISKWINIRCLINEWGIGIGISGASPEVGLYFQVGPFLMQVRLWEKDLPW